MSHIIENTLFLFACLLVCFLWQHQQLPVNGQQLRLKHSQPLSGTFHHFNMYMQNANKYIHNH